MGLCRSWEGLVFGGFSAKNGFSAKREKFPKSHTHAHEGCEGYNVRGAKQMLVNISAAVIPFPLEESQPLPMFGNESIF